jgi:adenine-specific DNA-methyltransferase
MCIWIGSGTTSSESVRHAEKLERPPLDHHRPRQTRLHDHAQAPDRPGTPSHFLYQAIGDYQVEAAKATLGRDFRIGDLSQIVLSLYGALPLPPEANPQRNLGQIAGVALVRPTQQQNAGAGRFAQQAHRHRHPEKAIAQRDNLLGGWDRVVVLGWNFDPALAKPSPR